jgi:hypothetical protein
MMEHRALVEMIGGKFVACCPTCGQIGVAEDFEADARAIADRHYAVRGFERRV